MHDSETPPPQTSTRDANGTDENINLLEALINVRRPGTGGEDYPQSFTAGQFGYSDRRAIRESMLSP